MRSTSIVPARHPAAVTLAPEHIAAIQEPIARHLRYLGRLRTRLKKRGFTPADLLYQRVQGAWSAVHALSVELHYLSCAPGTMARER
jgi:hypothetical protein